MKEVINKRACTALLLYEISKVGKPRDRKQISDYEERGRRGERE